MSRTGDTCYFDVGSIVHQLFMNFEIEHFVALPFRIAVPLGCRSRIPKNWTFQNISELQMNRTEGPGDPRLGFWLSQEGKPIYLAS